MRARARIAALLLLVACQTSGAGKAPDATCLHVEEGHGPPGATPVRAETVVSGLEVPWALAFLPDGDILVTERPGRLRLVRDGRLLPQPLAKIPVEQSAETGLMGIALHPDFAQNRSFYLALTAPGGKENRVELWRLSEDGTRAEFERVIFGGIPAAPIHDGGRIHIGPDRKLYVGTGDAGRPDRSQDLSTPAGKLLRLELDGSLPPDNPVPGSPVFLSGIRNTQGFDWLDHETLVVSDHGPSGEFGRRGGDEVSVARRGDNLGWPGVWRCERRAGLVAPVITWTRATPAAGVAIQRSGRIAAWDGSVFVATLGSRHLQRIVLDEKRRVRAHEVYFAGDPPEGLGRLREAIVGPDGYLYLTTSNCDGRGRCPPEKDRIVRVVPR